MFNFFLTCARLVQKKQILSASDERNFIYSNRNEPPDLEEFFKALRNKIQGEKNSDSEKPNKNNNFDNFGAPNPKFILFIIVAGLILWSLTGFYTVQERENGVETFLGKYQQSTGAGLNWNWPAPLGKVEKIDVTSIFTMRIGELKTQKGNTSTKEQRTGQMLTSDENIVEIGATVQYRIQDARRYLFVANQPEKVLEDIIISAIREVVGANKVDDILRDRRNEWPEQAKQIMVDLLKQYDFGIEIVAFELQDARAPAEVQDAFEDAVRAREDEERARLQAEAFANQRLPAARGEAEQMRQSAQAYRAQVLAKANAEVNRFNNILQAYRENPEVMKQRLYLDTMNMVYGNSKKIIIDTKNSKPIINLGQTKSETIVPVEIPTVKQHPSVLLPPKDNQTTAPSASSINNSSIFDARSRQR